MENTRRDNTFVATCVIYLVVLVGFIGLRIISGMSWIDNMDGWIIDVMFSVLSQVVLMVLVPLIGVMIYNRRKKRKADNFQTNIPSSSGSSAMTFAEFMKNEKSETKSFEREKQEDDGVRGIFSSWAFKMPSMQLVGWSILLGFCMFLFNIFVSSLFNGPLAGFGHRGASGGGDDVISAGAGWFFVVLIMTAVLPGFCEEVAHRGFLVKGFASRIGIMNAVFLSSVLFGLMHLNIVQVFYAGVLGYLMCLAVVATRNIWPAIIIHFMNNALATYIGFFGSGLFNWFANFMGSMPLLFYFAFFIGMYFIIIAIIHKLARDNFIKDNAKREVPLPLHRSKTMMAIKYYVTAGEPKKREPLSPLEMTLICSIVFLGTVITIMTLVWGFL